MKEIYKKWFYRIFIPIMFFLDILVIILLMTIPRQECIFFKIVIGNHTIC